MPNRMITLPDKLYYQLKKEQNASGLIQNLLIKHYNSLTPKNPEEIIKQVKQKMKENEHKEKFKKRNDEATEKLKESILKEIKNGN